MFKRYLSVVQEWFTFTQTDIPEAWSVAFECIRDARIEGRLTHREYRLLLHTLRGHSPLYDIGL
jgi:hypothetical protein